MTQTEFFGVGTINEVKGILEKHNPQHIFLVRGNKSYEACGAKAALDPLFENYKITEFHGFEVNPKIEDIKQGIELFKQANCDLVVAVGGGSVMDVAKAINLLSAQPGTPEDYVVDKKPLEQKGKPFVAIATTSGSGSEATQFAVIYVGKTKMGLDNEWVLPDYSIIDPQLTMSLSVRQTACAGADALCQGIESFWCVNSTDESKKYATEAIQLAMNSLGPSVNAPTLEAKSDLAKASNLAGKAINISRTTACHAIAYPMSSYFGVVHGHAVGLTVPSMLVYIAGVGEDDCLDERGVAYVKEMVADLVALLGCTTPELAAEKLTKLFQDIGLQMRLNEVGIATPEDRQVVVDNGFNPARVKNNPRKLTKEALAGMLDGLK